MRISTKKRNFSEGSNLQENPKRDFCPNSTCITGTSSRDKTTRLLSVAVSPASVLISCSVAQISCWTVRNRARRTRASEWEARALSRLYCAQISCCACAESGERLRESAVRGEEEGIS
jgi:hypothetical protein